MTIAGKKYMAGLWPGSLSVMARAMAKTVRTVPLAARRRVVRFVAGTVAAYRSRGAAEAERCERGVRSRS